MSRHGRDAISMLGLLSLSDTGDRSQCGCCVKGEVSRQHRAWVGLWFCFETVSFFSLGCSETLRVDQAGFELAACLCLLGAKVKRMFHHVKPLFTSVTAYGTLSL